MCVPETLITAALLTATAKVFASNYDVIPFVFVMEFSSKSSMQCFASSSGSSIFSYLAGIITSVSTLSIRNCFASI